MKVYDVVLTKEQAVELETNLYNTKILHAVVECRFKPLFGFLDRKGEVATALEKIFPDDDPHKGNLNIEMAIESVKLENPNTLTESCFQVNRAFFNRQNIVPTTLNHFTKIAKEHLILYKNLFPEIEELGRFGFRTKQLTRIKEEEANSARSKFNSQIIGVNPLFQRLKTNRPVAMKNAV